jgi:hypothetical protein
MDDGYKGSDFELAMIGYRNRDSGAFPAALHDDMTAFLPDLRKTVFLQDPAYFPSGKYAEFTHGRFQTGLRKRPHEAVA